MSLSVADNLASIRERISAACRAAVRDSADVRLLAVTKSATLDQIAQLIAAGQHDLAENRVQLLASRLAELPSRVLPETMSKLQWHMIGHLQRNKVRDVLPHVALTHSVDSLRLAQTISQEAQRLRHPAKILLQVNASQEPQKFGTPLGDAESLAQQAASLPCLEVCGLMTMAEFSDDPALVRSAFARTRVLFDRLAPQMPPSFRELSMGMSHDFELAIAEGATLLRIGSALFAGQEVQA